MGFGQANPVSGGCAFLLLSLPRMMRTLTSLMSTLLTRRLNFILVTGMTFSFFKFWCNVTHISYNDRTGRVMPIGNQIFPLTSDCNPGQVPVCHQWCKASDLPTKSQSDFPSYSSPQWTSIITVLYFDWYMFLFLKEQILRSLRIGGIHFYIQQNKFYVWQWK